MAERLACRTCFSARREARDPRSGVGVDVNNVDIFPAMVMAVYAAEAMRVTEDMFIGRTLSAR